jgi:hypothetical protein
MRLHAAALHGDGDAAAAALRPDTDPYNGGGGGGGGGGFNPNRVGPDAAWTEDGRAPLHVAAAAAAADAAGGGPVVAALLAARAAAGSADHDGQTPLHAAAAWGRRGALEALLDSGGRAGLYDIMFNIHIWALEEGNGMRGGRGTDVWK